MARLNAPRPTTTRRLRQFLPVNLNPKPVDTAEYEHGSSRPFITSYLNLEPDISSTTISSTTIFLVSLGSHTFLFYFRISPAKNVAENRIFLRKKIELSTLFLQSTFAMASAEYSSDDDERPGLGACPDTRQLSAHPPISSNFSLSAHGSVKRPPRLFGNFQNKRPGRLSGELR